MVKRKKEGMGFRGVSQKRRKEVVRRLTDEPKVPYLNATPSITGVVRYYTGSLKRLREAPVLPGQELDFLGLRFRSWGKSSPPQAHHTELLSSHLQADGLCKSYPANRVRPSDCCRDCLQSLESLQKLSRLRIPVCFFSGSLTLVEFQLRLPCIRMRHLLVSANKIWADFLCTPRGVD